MLAFGVLERTLVFPLNVSGSAKMGAPVRNARWGVWVSHCAACLRQWYLLYALDSEGLVMANDGKVF